MEEQVRKFMQTRVRPRLALHHGDVEMVALESGVLTVRLLGACRGCPSAADTLESVVLESVREQFPEVVAVRLEDSTSPDLLELAKKMLEDSRRRRQA